MGCSPVVAARWRQPSWKSSPAAACALRGSAGLLPGPGANDASPRDVRCGGAIAPDGSARPPRLADRASPRSDWRRIREWFAGLPETKARGYEPGRFSFNVKGGRCEACQGDGVIKIEMHFLPDVYVTCDVCKGKRYNRETLEVTFKGKSIADVLDMTVEEALEFFKAVPRVRDELALLHRVGLDYIHVGQQATTLSGGEAQRVKLAKELSQARHRPHALYPRRADHRPAFPRRGEAARSAARAGRDRQYGGGDRAQSGSDQDRRLDHRSRPGRRRRRRRDRGGGTPEEIVRGRRAATPGSFCRRCWGEVAGTSKKGGQRAAE